MKERIADLRNKVLLKAINIEELIDDSLIMDNLSVDLILSFGLKINKLDEILQKYEITARFSDRDLIPSLKELQRLRNNFAHCHDCLEIIEREIPDEKETGKTRIMQELNSEGFCFDKSGKAPQRITFKEIEEVLENIDHVMSDLINMPAFIKAIQEMN